MMVNYSMDFLPEIDSPVVTVGSFDGVHVGHRAIIGRLNALAEQVKEIPQQEIQHETVSSTRPGQRASSFS